MDIPSPFPSLFTLFTTPNTGNAFGPLEPILVQFMRNTPLELTVTNPAVMQSWSIVLLAANALFVLLIILGAIQTMVSSRTGSLSLPVSEFVPKVLVTALAMNLSAFFGRQLLLLNNALCGLVTLNFEAIFNTLNNGTRIAVTQSVFLILLILLFLNVGIIRLLFQAFERLVIWNLLFVLSPLAFLFAFLPVTSSVFTFWGRIFLMVTFTQFLQFLAFALAVQLIMTVDQLGLVSLILTIASLHLVAKVPDLVSRFTAMSSGNAQGVQRLLGTALVTARLVLTSAA